MYILRDTAETKDLDQDKKDAQNHLSHLYLCGNAISLVFVMVCGHLADKIRITHILNVLNAILFVSIGTMVYQIHSKLLQDIDIVFDVAFIVSYGFHICVFQIGQTIISKRCGEKIRGSMFFLNGMVGSIGITLFQYFAGEMFSNSSENAPFVMAFWLVVLLMISTFVCSAFGKIKY